MTAANSEPARTVDGLAETLFQDQLSSAPLYASQLGFSEYVAELPDLSLQGRDRRISLLRDVLRQGEQVNPEHLDGERRITLTMVLRQAADQLLSLEAAAERYTVTPLPQTGPAASLLIGVPKTVLSSSVDAEAYVRRCIAIPDWLEEAAGLLEQGAGAGLTPVRSLVLKSADQIRDYLAGPLADDPFCSVSCPAPDGWRDRLTGVVRDQVRPALARYEEMLRTRVAPGARPDERAGLVSLRDGAELYQRLVAQHTTTDHTVEQIHRIGVDLVAELTEELRELGARAFGSSEVSTITERLRHDPDLYFQHSGEVVAAAEDALGRAQEELPRWLALLPATGCEVRPMPAHEVENGHLGYYQWPSLDGSRPGTYWINTYRPTTRPRFEAQALAFHESVPGHHTQLALAQELTDQPAFRRHARVTAFTEGWALYVERLAEEMGLYTGDIERFGMISFDFWRACRLVVDTGMHAMGWSRDRAVSYMEEHSALTRKNIENEVDRYIGWPGQALGYMLGRLEIVRQRERAQDRLGGALSLRDFHAELIRHGPLPLSVVGGVVDSWLGTQAAAPKTSAR